MCGFTHTCDSKSNNCSVFFREHLHLKKNWPTWRWAANINRQRMMLSDFTMIKKKWVKSIECSLKSDCSRGASVNVICGISFIVDRFLVLTFGISRLIWLFWELIEKICIWRLLSFKKAEWIYCNEVQITWPTEFKKVIRWLIELTTLLLIIEWLSFITYTKIRNICHFQLVVCKDLLIFCGLFHYK